MRCYTVEETAKEGIPVHLGEDSDEAVIKVGEKTFPVSRSYRDSITVALAAAANAIKEEDLTEEERNGIADILRSRSIPIPAADLSPDGSRLQRSDRAGGGANRNCALVLVRTEAGLGGELNYTARTWREDQREDTGVVYRRHDPWEEAVGIQELLSSKGQKLLIMMPKSGFQIRRTGDFGDAPAVLSIDWKVHALNVTGFAYKKARRRSA